MSYEPYIFVFARALGSCALLPFDKIGNGGYSFRIALSSLIAILIAPSLTISHPLGAILLFQEFITGALVVMPVILLIECGAMWGEIFDTGRGQTIGSILDPGSGASQPHTALLCREVCTVWLFLSGAFESLVTALSESLYSFPPMEWTSLTFEALGKELMNLLGSSISGVFGVLIPFVFLFMSIEVGASFVGKLAPISLSGEAFITKTALGALSVVALITFGGMESLPSLLQKFQFP